MSGGVVRYKTAGSTSEPSPILWADCPVLKFITDPGEGIYLWDDFVTGGLVADTSVPGWNLVGTNPDVSQVTDDVNGQIVLEGSGADNDSAFICTPDLYLLKKNSGKRLWFEARVSTEAAGAADDYAIFVGLIESAGMTAELIADNGATVIDEDYVGFFADSNATTIQPWNIQINQGSSANFPVDVSANVLAQATAFKKYGIGFDGKQTLSFYIDGVLTATYDVDNLDSDTFAHEAGVAIGTKNCEGAELHITVDWVRFACDKVAQG